jgi:hypothetical protein
VVAVAQGAGLGNSQLTNTEQPPSKPEITRTGLANFSRIDIVADHASAAYNQH